MRRLKKNKNSTMNKEIDKIVSKALALPNYLAFNDDASLAKQLNQLRFARRELIDEFDFPANSPTVAAIEFRLLGKKEFGRLQLMRTLHPERFSDGVLPSRVDPCSCQEHRPEILVLWPELASFFAAGPASRFKECFSPDHSAMAMDLCRRAGIDDITDYLHDGRLIMVALKAVYVALSRQGVSIDERWQSDFLAIALKD
jgi:hypothetical protein